MCCAYLLLCFLSTNLGIIEFACMNAYSKVSSKLGNLICTECGFLFIEQKWLDSGGELGIQKSWQGCQLLGNYTNWVSLVIHSHKNLTQTQCIWEIWKRSLKWNSYVWSTTYYPFLFLEDHLELNLSAWEMKPFDTSNNFPVVFVCLCFW